MNESQIFVLILWTISLIMVIGSNDDIAYKNCGEKNNGIRIGLKRWYSFIISTTMLLIVVYRPPEMADYNHYEEAFNMSGVPDRFEPSFELLKIISQNLDWGFLGLLALYGILSISIKMYCVYTMSNQFYLSVFAWISTSFVLMDMITIRASVACALMLLSIKYRVDNKKIWMIFALVSAVLFHYSSAILLLIIPFLSSKKTYRLLYIWLIPICMFLQIVGLTVSRFIPRLGIMALTSLYSGYSDDSAANLFNLLSIARCLIAIFLWLTLSKWYTKNIYALLSVKVYTIGCALFMLFGDLLRVGFRFAELFWCTDIIVYPLLSYCFLKKSKIWPVIVCSILFFIAITKESYWHPNT